MSKQEALSGEELLIQAVLDHPPDHPKTCALMRIAHGPGENLTEIAHRFGLPQAAALGVMDGWDGMHGWDELSDGTLFQNEESVLADPQAYQRGKELGVRAYNLCNELGKLSYK